MIIGLAVLLVVAAVVISANRNGWFTAPSFDNDRDTMTRPARQQRRRKAAEVQRTEARLDAPLSVDEFYRLSFDIHHERDLIGRLLQENPNDQVG